MSKIWMLVLGVFSVVTLMGRRAAKIASGLDATYAVSAQYGSVGEMRKYLTDIVRRQAMSLNRRQVPQVFGDAGRVLIGQ